MHQWIIDEYFKLSGIKKNLIPIQYTTFVNYNEKVINELKSIANAKHGLCLDTAPFYRSPSAARGAKRSASAAWRGWAAFMPAL